VFSSLPTRPASGGAQSLDLYVDLNGDDDGLDINEHPLSSLGAVDNDWSAGHVGLYRGPAGSSIQRYDNVKTGYDNNADGDIDDAGDDVQVAESLMMENNHLIRQPRMNQNWWLSLIILLGLSLIILKLVAVPNYTNYTPRRVPPPIVAMVGP